MSWWNSSKNHDWTIGQTLTILLCKEVLDHFEQHRRQRSTSKKEILTYEMNFQFDFCLFLNTELPPAKEYFLQ